MPMSPSGGCRADDHTLVGQRVAAVKGCFARATKVELKKTTGRRDLHVKAAQILLWFVCLPSFDRMLATVKVSLPVLPCFHAPERCVRGSSLRASCPTDCWWSPRVPCGARPGQASIMQPQPAAAGRSLQFGSAGHAIHSLNSRSLSKGDPRLVAVKRCCDQAVAVVFAGHANVQLQGSAAKGTALQTLSDWDFFVNLDATIPTTTHAQRMRLFDSLASNLSAAGITYRMRCGEHVIKLDQGRDAAGPLPDVDVVLHRFKASERLPPDSRAMADSHAAQQVVRYIKALPGHFSNLPLPKSSLLEQLVKAVDNHLRCQQGVKGAALSGAAGFDLLLTWTLRAVAGSGGLQHVNGMRDKINKAGVGGSHWCDVASRVLNLRAARGGWPYQQG